jgi:hypothetical protein
MSIVPSPSAPPSGYDEYYRKLREVNPNRQLIRMILEPVLVLAAVGFALYVILHPEVHF